ncbi:hypothetical protein [Cytobacillus sp. IB215316]|uniref:hypothetical protein n=1 Tax=Cytobacillus sp. IB215316 TaxID=3097354 RepID=UPI002A0F7B6A|nr:hypothetical protein [Cytobacillus sp. IB215316]MDX8359214.1 hypothetical protein [Cytobacillus sp. IB215316]
MDYREHEVLKFIYENFPNLELEIQNLSLFPFGKRIIDINGYEIFVYYCPYADSVKTIFPNVAEVKSPS